MPLTPLSDWCKHKAIFYDSQGHYVGKKRLDFSTPTFTFMKRGYNFVPLRSSFFRYGGFLWSTKFYFYNLDNPDPLVVKNPVESCQLNSLEYGVLLESDAIKKVNDLSKKNWLLEMLTMPNMIILGVAVLVFFWIKSRGGKLW